jgi:hypothetical protein
LETWITHYGIWELGSVFVAPDNRFALRFLWSVTERCVKMFSILLHDADPIHAYGHFPNRSIQRQEQDVLLE